MSVKIAIDVGHGLKTAGKQTPTGIKEWELNDKVADIVEAILSDYDVEIIRLDNNEGNTDESLSSRYTRYINAGVKLMVSIHHNAFKSTWSDATGVEVYTDAKPTAEDKKLANLIYNKMVAYTGLKGRGVKHVGFYVINQNKIPAVLCEGGFMDGKKDYDVITSKSGQEAYAKAVAEGIIEFLTLKKKQAPLTKRTALDVALDIMAGKYGMGHNVRRPKVEAEGFNYEEVRAIVNQLSKPASAPKVNCYPKYTGTSGSIVSALKSLNVNSSFDYRKKIAKANGITLYLGTAAQNTKMLNLLKQGKLIKI